MTPEFSRPLRRAELPTAGSEITVTAGPAECAALAARFHLPAIHALACRFRLTPEPGGTVAVAGTLAARVRQVCVVTLEEFDRDITDAFALRLVPPGAAGADDDPETIDAIEFAGDAVDLGEATAEQLALVLDPYPRAPGALLGETLPTTEAAGRQGGALAGLAALRDRQ